jgi:hypothetical protein
MTRYQTKELAKSLAEEVAEEKRRRRSNELEVKVFSFYKKGVNKTVFVADNIIANADCPAHWIQKFLDEKMGEPDSELMALKGR